MCIRVPIPDDVVPDSMHSRSYKFVVSPAPTTSSLNLSVFISLCLSLLQRVSIYCSMCKA